MPSFFISGTDTDVGKTYVTCVLLRSAVRQGWRAIGMKPLAAGCELLADGSLSNEDVRLHEQAGNVDAPLALRNPYAFAPPISPHLAAREAGVQPDIDLIVARHRQLLGYADLVLVEGAGGWLAPLSDQHSMADLARALGLPVILVVGMRLGCLNHALLTARAIAQDGLPLAGWVANQIDPNMARAQDNLDYLKCQLNAPLLGVLPHSGDKKNSVSNQEQMLDCGLKSLMI